MPKFAFTVDDGRTVPETTVVDLTDFDHAKSEAIRAAGEMLADIGAGVIWDGVPWNLTVKDENGRPALEVHFLINTHPDPGTTTTADGT